MKIKIFQILALVLLLVAIPCYGMAANSRSDMKRAEKALAQSDYQTAFAIYQRYAVDEKDPLAQFTLGLFYENGWGKPIDRKKACELYEQASAGDIPAAAHLAAECVLAGVHRPSAPDDAAALLEQAGNQGHYLSFCSLGELYMKGQGVAKDPAKGLEFCAQAANQNVPKAKLLMGQFLLEGDPAIRNYGEAINWFQAAAQDDLPEAQYSLGIMARDGLGMEKNRQAAINWLEQAASHGYAPAYLPTGQLYITPPPGAEDLQPPAEELAKAYLWLSAAKASSSPQDRIEAEKALQDVQKIMPSSWVPELDQKVAQHLAEFPPQQQPGLK